MTDPLLPSVPAFENPPPFDVAVVGAGPGGATCAWKCAEAGLSVVLLERAQSLPRYKPCGGGIPDSLFSDFPDLDPLEFGDLTVGLLRHTWKGKDPVLARMETASGETASVLMVQRPRFDAHLVNKAVCAGAELVTNTKISRVEKRDDGVYHIASVGGQTWRARHVVGADGAKGIVGTQTGLRLGKRWGMAREIEIPFVNTSGSEKEDKWHPQLTPFAAYLDYGSVPNGYAWIFPKRGFLSVGAGMLLPRKPSEDKENNVARVLRRAIDTMLGSVGMTYPDEPDAPKLWAHPIPFWTGAEPLTTPDNGVLLVGDAAGVVQPLFGEGIQYAVRTGAMAAQHIANGTVADYTGAVRDLFAPEFDAALRVGRVFHRAPYLSYRLGVKNPAGTRLVGRLMAGEAHLADLESRIYERLKNPLRR